METGLWAAVFRTKWAGRGSGTGCLICLESGVEVTEAFYWVLVVILLVMLWFGS